jgi:hypothetical protein
MADLPLAMRTKRTLWGIGIGALVAMMFVPVMEYGGYGRTLAERRSGGHYRLIVQSGGADINVPQLVLNVVFAALLGAVCANMSRRAWRWAGGCAALVAVVGGIIALIEVRSAAIARAQSDEKELTEWYQAERPKTEPEKEAFLAKAKSILLNAANNWFIAGDWAQARKLRAQAKNLSLPPARSQATPDLGDYAALPVVNPTPTPKTDKTIPDYGAFADLVPQANSPSPTAAVSKYADLPKAAAATPSPSRRDIFDEVFDELARTQLKPDDLKKIILFDVDPKSYPLTNRDGTYSIRGFHGRLRNELSRPVERIVLRVSIYNGARELIEVKNLLLPDTTVAPGSPVAFDRYISFNYVPKGYSYRVEVIEAHYVK